MIEYVINWLVVPAVISWSLTRFFWGRLNASKKPKRGSPDRIKTLISTEEQGGYVNVSFLMGDDSVRHFQVRWLENLGVPNGVVDMDSWEVLSSYGSSESRLYRAAEHAATLHHNGGGKTNKNVYDANQDWRLM